MVLLSKQKDISAFVAHNSIFTRHLIQLGMHCTMHLDTINAHRHYARRHYALRHYDFFPLNTSDISSCINRYHHYYTPSRPQRTAVTATPRTPAVHPTPASDHSTHLGAIANSPKYSVIANMVAAL